MEIFVSIIGGVGIGALLNTVLVFWISRKKDKREKLYQEKREAYFGILQALHQAAIQPSDKHSKDFALWQAKCNLFSPNDVNRAIQGIIATNNGPREQREKYFNDMVDSMRRDINNSM